MVRSESGWYREYVLRGNVDATTGRGTFGRLVCSTKFPRNLAFFDKSSAAAEMGDRGHNRHGPKRGGCYAPFAGGELGPRLTQCGDIVLDEDPDEIWHISIHRGPPLAHHI